MDVKGMVVEWLKAHGCDGLCKLDDVEGCGCGIDDLGACGFELPPDCVPAKLYRATAEDIDAGFEGEVGDDIYKEATIETPAGGDTPGEGT